MGQEKTYVAIDLKSFYASVECVDRGLDPLDANLVVADESRTEKTICLAVSPSLKSFGISGRARLFEAIQRVNEVNAERRRKIRGEFTSSSSFLRELKANPSLKLDFIIAPPRMARYMEVSTAIYDIYLKYVSKQDVHVYSIDEVFIDATDYLKMYKTDARGFTMMLIKDVLSTTGITATAGIGTNLYLCKIAMDIVAKHIPADADGVRIAELDERKYREELWEHTPITDFWRVGKGIADRLATMGLYTMGDVALQSVTNEEKLYRAFGVNAELIIDHAWGYENCTMEAIKNYRTESCSISSGQVLSIPYDYAMSRLIMKEMADSLALDLVEKRLVTDQLIINVNYDTGNFKDSKIRSGYKGAVSSDWYGRPVPKEARGSINTGGFTSSTKTIVESALELFDRITDRGLVVRRLNICASHVIPESQIPSKDKYVQLDLFTDAEAEEEKEKKLQADAERERRAQDAIIGIKKKYGKNAIVKGMNLQKGATAMERNRQVGGHKA